MSLPLIYIFHPYIRYIYNYYIVHIKACNISIASAPLTSPTMIRSGRIRSDARIRSLISTAPSPSALAPRVSRRTRLGIWVICNSAESSIIALLGVDSSTLWRWAKSGYLVPVEYGGQRRYRVADVQRILNGGRHAR